MTVRIELGLSPEREQDELQVHELIARIEGEAGPQLVAAARARAEATDDEGGHRQ